MVVASDPGHLIHPPRCSRTHSQPLAHPLRLAVALSLSFPRRNPHTRFTQIRVKWAKIPLEGCPRTDGQDSGRILLKNGPGIPAFVVSRLSPRFSHRTPLASLPRHLAPLKPLNPSRASPPLAHHAHPLSPHPTLSPLSPSPPSPPLSRPSTPSPYPTPAAAAPDPADPTRPTPGGGPGSLTVLDNRTGKKYEVPIHEVGPPLLPFPAVTIAGGPWNQVVGLYLKPLKQRRRTAVGRRTFPADMGLANRPLTVCSYCSEGNVWPGQKDARIPETTNVIPRSCSA